MKKIIISTLAIAGLALTASSAFAHGRVVSGEEVYAPPSSAQEENAHTHIVGKSDNGVEAREFRAVQRNTHWLRSGDDY